MKRHILLFAMTLVGILLLGGVARAAQATGASSFLLQIDGSTHIAADEVIGTVIAANGDVVVDGRVTDTLWLYNGTATVNGQVGGDIVVVNGTLHLAAGASVRNVALVRSTIDQAQGAMITGELSQRTDFFSFWDVAAFTFLFWIGTTLVILLAGLVFAALGYRQLAESAAMLTTRPLESVVAALIVWIGLPLLGVLAFVTLVGIPLGITIFLVVLPVLWLLGYITVGEGLGWWLTRLAGRPPLRYVSVIVGLIILQLIALLPAIGGPIGTLVGLVGAGALAYRLYQHRVEQRTSAQQAPAPGPI